VAVAGLGSVGSGRAITRPITAAWSLLNQGHVSAPLSEYEWGQSGAGEGRSSLLYTRGDARLIRRLVRPFYLKMYLVEAPTEVDPDAARRFRRKLIRAGRRPTSEQVEWLLLSGGWREQTMGAWFALAVPADRVREAVAAAWIDASSHAAGPLAVVSALITGSDVVAGMQSFVARRDDRDDLGTAEYVPAAIAHLGGPPPFDPDPIVVASFQDSLKVATDLQSDFRTARRSAWRAPLWRSGRKSYTVDP
jgi:hypothetical protein